MKTKLEIIKVISSIIEDITFGQIKHSDISTDHRLIDDLNLDSLDYATVLVSTETKLNIKIEEDGLDWSKIRTVGQLADLFFQVQ